MKLSALFAALIAALALTACGKKEEAAPAPAAEAPAAPAAEAPAAPAEAPAEAPAAPAEAAK